MIFNHNEKLIGYIGKFIESSSFTKKGVFKISMASHPRWDIPVDSGEEFDYHNSRLKFIRIGSFN